MSGKTAKMVGETPPGGATSGQFEFPQQNLRSSFSFVVTCHGDKEHPTTIWYWSAGSVEPAVPAKATLFDATGPDAKLAARNDGNITAAGKWEHGRWRVLMKRPRKGENGDLSFGEGTFIPVSFANWDGNNGEIGSKHTLTSWYWLILPTQPDPLRVYGMPAGAALLTFLACFGLVRRMRRRKAA